jgi:multicomponent Na+:H+ antiporter subunit E
LRSKKDIFIVILLYAIWIIISADLSIASLVLGLLISLSVDLVISHSSFTRKVAEKFIRNFLWFIWYGIIIGIEVFVASYQVAFFVLNPKTDFKPGIIKLKLDLGKKNKIMKLTVLANIITLTPGTVAVASNINKNELYIHWMDLQTGDTETIKEAMIGNFDKIVRRLFS